MVTDFVIWVKCIIFWRNIGLRVYYDFDASDKKKKIIYFNTFQPRKPRVNCGCFVIWVKCTLFWLNRGLKVFFDLYVPHILSTFFTLVLKKSNLLKKITSLYFLENLAHTNKIIPSNLYWAQKIVHFTPITSQLPHFRFNTILLVQLSWRVASPLKFVSLPLHMQHINHYKCLYCVVET